MDVAWKLVIRSKISVTSRDEAVERILDWAKRRESRFVALCNAHVTVTAWRDRSFGASLDTADLVLPDGAPVAWMLRRQGILEQKRVAGPDLMPEVMARCAMEGVPVYFFGSTDDTLNKLSEWSMSRFPDLSIVGSFSPPFRDLTANENEGVVAVLNASSAGVIFVGLGCPKQERWIAAHKGSIHAVMIGVGAAFDFLSGSQKRAPAWVRSSGLEWMHRLLSEPERLWKRYLITNSLFCLGALAQLLGFNFNGDSTKGLSASE